MRFSTFSLVDTIDNTPSESLFQMKFGITGYAKLFGLALAICYGKLKRSASHMAHVQKFTKGHVQGLSIHLERKTNNHSNKDIDVTRSHLNYDLCTKPGDTLTRLKDRLKHVHCFNRADVKVCADWVVTLPEPLKELPAHAQRRFFEATYAFLTHRYGGEQNVLSANVHNDETTPHLHFAFVPVVFDKKKQCEKVSAKEVLTRKDLQDFHPALDTFLKQEIPDIYQEGILNGKTVGVENVKELKQFGDEIKRQKQAMTAELKVFQHPQKVLEKVELSVKKTWFGDNVQLPTRNYEQLKSLALAGMKIKIRLEQIETAANETTDALARATERANQAEEQVRVLLPYQQQAILLNSKLADTQQTVEMSELERRGRLILHVLEKGHAPRDEQEGMDWLTTLEANEQAKLIPTSRLEHFLELLRRFLQHVLGQTPTFNIDAVKRKQATLDDEPSVKKQTRGFEL